MSNEIPQIVYKYRDWNNQFHKNILLHNEIYLASPGAFNDPFDCKIPRNFHSLTQEDREQFKQDLATKERHKFVGKEVEFNDHLKNLSARMDNIDSFQKEDEESYFKQMNAHYGIFSLSRIFDGILLWSQYGANHTGFCIGFWEEKLRTSYGLCNRTGCVSYRQKFPDIKPKIKEDEEEKLSRIHIQTTTKSIEWKYEKEYRLLKAFETSPLPFERCVYVDNDVFSNVTLGINISDRNSKEITQICKQKGIPVYQAKKVPFKFEIEREQIA